MFEDTQNALVYFLVFVLLVLGAVAASNVWLYREFAAELDRSLGERLRSTAQAASLLVDAELLAETAPDSVGLNLAYVEFMLADRLAEFVRNFGIDEILLVDSRFQLVYDSGETYPVGDRYPHLEQDAAAIQRAVESGGGSSPTHRAARAYLKRGFAPIVNQSGDWVALLVVEADVDFFDLLKTWKRTLTTVTVGIGAILVLLALLFMRLWSAGERARRRLIRQDKLAALGMMVSQVAHEVRNPLGIIRISAQRLRRTCENPEQGRMVDYVLSEAERVDGIVERYLDYAKGRPAERRRVVTAKLVDEVLNEFPLPESGQVALEKRVAGPDAVWIDPARFKQMLYNLIDNSVKAGARRVTVAVDPDPGDPEGTVRWRVEDDGEGVAPRQRRRVLEPFYTTRADGSGLGLSIVQQIAEEHGGAVSIRSRPGGGTVVTVRIPNRAPPGEGESDGENPGH